MKMTTGELHTLDFGVHCHLLEEWNEDSRYEWGEADVVYSFPYSVVTHRCVERSSNSLETAATREDIVVVAQYATDGEGGHQVVDGVRPSERGKPRLHRRERSPPDVKVLLNRTLSLSGMTCYDLQMALQPAVIPKSSFTDAQLEALVDAFGRGEHPFTIAKKLHPTNRAGQRRVRNKIEREILHNPALAERIIMRAKAEMLMGLIPAARGLAGRATRRTDATKLLFEATGFHNPRVQHEHSGDITVRLEVPRPNFVGDVTSVEDAETVE